MAPERPLRWPQSFATVFRGVLPDAVLHGVCSGAEAWARCPNYWVPKEDFVGGGRPAASPAEAAVTEAYKRCVRMLLDEGELAGAEWWVQVYQPGQGLAFHFDKDEALFKGGGEMRHPILSSVLYLSGNSAADAPRLGPTVIIDQRFDNGSRQAVPEQPERCCLVWPQLNSLAVFDGRLGHGVLDCASQGRRATMLINWWAYQPQAVTERPLAASDASGPAAETAETADEAAAARTADGAAEQPTEAADLLPPVAVPVLRLPAGEEGAVYTVDDLLDSHGLGGGSAPQAAAFDHCGYHLYPISAEDEQIQGLATAAAYVFGEPESSSSSSGSEA